jgi:hypothetical protein
MANPKGSTSRRSPERDVSTTGLEAAPVTRWYPAIPNSVDSTRKRVSSTKCIGKLGACAVFAGAVVAATFVGEKPAQAAGPAPVQIGNQFYVNSVGDDGTLYGSSDLDIPTKPDQVAYSEDLAVMNPSLGYLQTVLNTESQEYGTLRVMSGPLAGLLSLGGPNGKVTKCNTIDLGTLTISDCNTVLPTPMGFYTSAGMALHPDGASVVIGASQVPSDNFSRAYKVEADGTVALIPTCGAASYNFFPSTIVNGKIYFVDNSSAGNLRAYQQTFDLDPGTPATDCDGPKVLLGNVPGYDSSLSSAQVGSLAIDKKTGTVYFSKATDYTFWKADKAQLCGDNFIETGESCDGANLWGADCVNINQGFTGGTLACNPATCTYDTTNCTNGMPVCGNGAVEMGETCDNGGANGVPCSAPYGGSCNYCDVSCQPQTVQGAWCGDGTKNGPEECDLSDLNGDTCVTQGFDTGNLSCAPNCTFDTTDCSKNSGTGGAGGAGGAGGSGGAGGAGGSGGSGGAGGGMPQNCPVTVEAGDSCTLNCADIEHPEICLTVDNDTCDAEYKAFGTPDNVQGAIIKIKGLVGECIKFYVATLGEDGSASVPSNITNFNVPEDNNQKLGTFNPNKFNITEGVEMTVEGTGYDQIRLPGDQNPNEDVVTFSTQKGLTRLPAMSFTIPGFTQGQLPPGYYAKVKFTPNNMSVIGSAYSVCNDNVLAVGSEICEQGQKVDCTTISADYQSGEAVCNSTCNGYDTTPCTENGTGGAGGAGGSGVGGSAGEGGGSSNSTSGSGGGENEPWWKNAIVTGGGGCSISNDVTGFYSPLILTVMAGGFLGIRRRKNEGNSKGKK